MFPIRHALLRFTDEAGVEIGRLVSLDFSLAANDIFKAGPGETSSDGPNMDGGHKHIDEDPEDRQQSRSQRPAQGFCAIDLTSGGMLKGTATFGMHISQCSTKA